MKKISYLFSISLIIMLLIISPEVLATDEIVSGVNDEETISSIQEEEISSDIKDNQIVESEIIINYDNYYEMNEKIHTQEKDNYYEPSIYMSDSESLSFRDYMLQEMKKHNENIDVTAYNIPFAETAKYITLLYGEPEFFAVYGATWRGYQNGITTTVTFNYIMTKEEISSNWEVINKVVEEYLSGIKPEWNDLEKIIYTNNYLCKKCEYSDDLVSPRIHTMVAALVDERPVCDGYSKAFMYLLKQAQIEAVLTTSDPMNHAWNLVKLDGNYYHVDVTWNDIKGDGKTQYKYFLVSDKEFLNNREHYSWVSDVAGTSEKYDNSDWFFVDNYLIYKDDYWYYIKNPESFNDQSRNSFELTKINYRNNETSKITVNVSDFIFWFPGLTEDSKNLYFTTQHAIWKMNYDGTEIEELYRLEDIAKIVYSVEFRNNKFYYDTTDLVNGGSSTESKKTNVYIVPGSEVIYTTLKLDEKLENVLNFGKDNLIKTVLTEANFPVLGIYEIKIVDKDENIKQGENERIGSKNAIVISNEAGEELIRYIAVIKGDVTGNGYARMYDAFQILKDTIIPGVALDEIDIKIRDYNEDGNVRMYDAFQFLKDSILR